MDKLNEQMVVLQFAELLDDWPKGKLQAAESPDFILKVSPRKAIGIELTELKGQDFINHTGRLINPGEILENLRDTISAKDEKLILYQRKKLVQIWLLIHVEELKKQVNFNLKNKLNQLEFGSGFNRLFLLETKPGRLTELTNNW